MARHRLAPVFAAALCVALAPTARAITLTPGFTSESVVANAGWDTPTCLAFMPDGRLLVGEKAGRVWVVRNGVKQATPLIDLTTDVLDEFDRGLLGVGVDPNYPVNHYVYFLYTVDPDSDNVDSNADGYGRLVRYRTSAADSNVVDPATRTLLFGANWRDSPIDGSPSHSVGAIRWGRDGSMLVSMGDGAQYNGVDSGGQDAPMFGPSLADPYQDIGAYRAQNLWSMNGKILRIDPATGHGYPSNPYWDGDPTSVRSRVWSYGLRNPFRFTVRPGTGSTNAADGTPGTLYIGDVGWNTWEELDVAAAGGLNFGWPCNEGFASNDPYLAAPPSHGGCDSLGTTWDPAQPSAPLVAWSHDDPDASTPPGSKGITSIGGVFYTGTRYPNLYRGHYFFADWGSSWIKVALTDDQDQLTDVIPFATDADGPVDFAVGPVSGDLYYVAINAFDVRRIRYGGVGAAPPFVSEAASPLAGAPPLAVTFSSAGSYDIDGDELSYTWNFGDGATSNESNPTHTYVTPGIYDAILTVEDAEDSAVSDTVVVTVSPMPTFPKKPVLDTFTRPNGGLGAGWVGSVTGLVIDGNQVAEPSGGYANAIWSATVFDTTQEAYFTIATTTANAPEHDVLLKVQGTSGTSAHVELRYDDAANQLTVWTYAPAEDWVLRGGPFPYVIHDGDQIGARAFGDGRVMAYVNHALIATVDCSGWQYAHAGGRIGFALSDAVNSRIDDFGGGNSMLVNHPPTAAIYQPAADTAFFAAGDTLQFVGGKVDLDDPQSALTGQWTCVLEHGAGTDTLSQQTGDVTTVPTASLADSTDASLLLRFIVTDTGGLRDTATVHVFPENDLEPSPVTLLPGPVSSEGAAVFHFSIRNHGRMPAPTMHWALTAGGATLAQGDTAIAALDSVVFQRSLTVALPPGEYALRLRADSLNAVPETNEANNASMGDLVVTGTTLAVGDGPLTLALSNPWPNPTAGHARLELTLPAESRVSFSVLDVQGRVVWELPEHVMPPGRAQLEWDGRRDGAPVSPGLYLARVTIDGRPMIRRIALVH